MFLREMILSETSDEDRAIVSLATAVTMYLRNRIFKSAIPQDELVKLVICLIHRFRHLMM